MWRLCKHFIIFERNSARFEWNFWSMSFGEKLEKLQNYFWSHSNRRLARLFDFDFLFLVKRNGLVVSIAANDSFASFLGYLMDERFSFLLYIENSTFEIIKFFFLPLCRSLERKHSFVRKSFKYHGLKLNVSFRRSCTIASWCCTFVLLLKFVLANIAVVNC